MRALGLSKAHVSRLFLVVEVSLVLAVSVAGAAETRAKRARTRPASLATAPAEEGDLSGARSEVYKKVDGVELRIYFFMPPGHKPTDKRPAIVFFFGGGWLRGSPGQFVPQCRYLASRGMVAATADYRVYERHSAMIADCTADAQAAVRWVRTHARELASTPIASWPAAVRPAAIWLPPPECSRTLPATRTRPSAPSRMRWCFSTRPSI